MSALQEVNQKFNIDIEQLKDDKALLVLLRECPEKVHFHVDCFNAALCHEGGLRCLPYPPLYCKEMKERDLMYFDDKNMWLNKLWRLETNMLLNDTVQTSTESTFQKLVYFVIFSCSLKLAPVENKRMYVFLVQANTADECRFNSQRGITSLLYHSTTQQSLYSICRNGIKSMSNEGKFCSTGAIHGPGIYTQQSERS